MGNSDFDAFLQYWTTIIIKTFVINCKKVSIHLITTFEGCNVNDCSSCLQFLTCQGDMNASCTENQNQKVTWTPLAQEIKIKMWVASVINHVCAVSFIIWFSQFFNSSRPGEMYIYVNELSIIVWGSSIALNRWQTCTNNIDDILSTRPLGKNSEKFQCKWNNFNLQTCFSKCYLQNGGHSFPTCFSETVFCVIIGNTILV